jgi:hypothetical protein
MLKRYEEAIEACRIALVLNPISYSRRITCTGQSHIDHRPENPPSPEPEIAGAARPCSARGVV